MIRQILRLFLFFILFSQFTSGVLAYKAIIFDCDGVLVDTEGLKHRAWQEELTQHNIDFTLDEYISLVGYSSQHIITTIQKMKNIILLNENEIIESKNKRYRELQKAGVPSLSFGVDFLRKALELRKLGIIKLALASSDGRAEILQNLKSIEVNPDNFDIILSGRDDLSHINDPQGTNKPKPYIYQLTAQNLGISPKDCIVFEDSNAGVEAAFTAGMDVMAVPNEFTKNQDFSHALKVTKFIDVDIDTLL